MTNHEDDLSPAEQWRQALRGKKIVDLFKATHGRRAGRAEELMAWAISPEGKEVLKQHGL